MRRRVILESPYAAPDTEGLHANREYAQRAMFDSLMRGEAPMVSHLLYSQVLSDRISGQRKVGIDAGLAWGTVADATVVYTDRGISPGMQIGIDRAHREGRKVEMRKLDEAEPCATHSP